MNKSIYIALLFGIAFAFSCKNQEGNFRVGEANIVTKIDKIALIDKSQFYIQSNSIIKKVDNNRILIFDSKEKRLIILDTSFTTLNDYDLSKYNYSFNGNIEDIEPFYDTFFMIDNSFRMKIFNPNSETIQILPDLLGGAIRPFTSNIKIVRDSLLVSGLTTIYPSVSVGDSIVKKDNAKKKKKYLVGTITNNNTKKITSLLISEENMQFKNELLLGSEQSFVNALADTICINFMISNYVIKFDTNGKFIKRQQIYTDNKYYPEPELEESSVGNKVRRLSKIVPVNSQSLECVNNKYYRIEFKGVDNNSFLVQYNDKFEIENKYELNGLLGNVNYNFIVISDYLYVIAKNDSFLYKIKIR